MNKELIDLMFEHAMKLKKGEIMLLSEEDKEYRRRVRELKQSLANSQNAQTTPNANKL